MNNCLITKLKGFIDNENLHNLYELDLSISSVNNGEIRIVNSQSDVKIIMTGVLSVTVDSSTCYISDNSTSFVLNPSDVYKKIIITSTIDGMIRILTARNIKALYINCDARILDYTQLNYTTDNFYYVPVNQASFTVDLNKLEKDIKIGQADYFIVTPYQEDLQYFDKLSFEYPTSLFMNIRGNAHGNIHNIFNAKNIQNVSTFRFRISGHDDDSLVFNANVFKEHDIPPMQTCVLNNIKVIGSLKDYLISTYKGNIIVNLECTSNNEDFADYFDLVSADVTIETTIALNLPLATANGISLANKNVKMLDGSWEIINK